MADSLPALNAPVSFIVQNNEAIGPMPMEHIIAGVRHGEQDAHSLVWWAGAGDWTHFDSHPDLMELVRQPESPRPLTTEIVEPGDTAAVAVESPPSLTGLFSASAREENGLQGSESASTDDAVEAIVSARSVLASAASREKAINQARHHTLAAALSGPAALAEELTPDESPVHDVPGGRDSADDAEDTEVSIVDLATDQKDEASEPDRSKHEEHFDELVKKSEEHRRRLEWATRVDEIILSGCIGAITERGYLAMDLSSRETEHQVLFESEKDSRFVMVEIIPLDQVNAAGDSVGRHLEIKMSWGQDVSDVDSAFAVVRSLASDETRKPGKVRAEIDTASSRVFTTVDLIWAADDFVSAAYDVDGDALDDAVAAALHILERRWYKLFIRRR